MFAKGLVPDGHNVRPLFGGGDERAELGLCLMSETVSNPDAKLGERKHESQILSDEMKLAQSNAAKNSMEQPRLAIAAR